MNMIMAIGLGGAFGAVMRHYAVAFCAKMAGNFFPYGTLFVNVTGSLLIGILMESLALKWPLSLEMRAFLITGLLGGFTTFSAFSFDLYKLIETGHVPLAALYIILSVFLSLAALFAGVYIVRGVVA